MTMAATRLKVLAFSHPGAVRMHNEDSVAIGTWIATDSMPSPVASVHDLSDPISVIVFDGMGGHNAGEVASRLAAMALSAALKRRLDADALAAEIKVVNQAVFDAAGSSPDHAGMGTTVAGLWFCTERAFWFNVGDSRVYRYRDDFLRQLSIDDIGISGGITQALGGAASFINVEPHVDEEPIVPGWNYLICSDGLTDMVPFDAIEAALSEPPEIAIRSLFESAMAAGGHDNISLVLIEVEAPIEVSGTDALGGDNV